MGLNRTRRCNDRRSWTSRIPLRPSASSAVIFFLLLASAEAQSTLHFRALEPIAFAVGEEAGSQAFTLADLNGDARLDLVVIDRDNDQFAVLLGNGDGTFAAARFYELEDTPTAVAVADFASPFASEAQGDLDGHPDVVVAQEDGAAVIFLGRGDGDFDPPEQDISEVLDSAELVGFVVDDFDRNGRPDLALLDAFDEVYFLCDLAGNLSPCPTDVLETLGEDPVAIVGGDFDGDTFRDVAVLNLGSRDLSPIYGRGNGLFVEVAEPVSTSAEGDQEPRHLAAGKLDDDDIDDLVVGNYSTLVDPVLLALYGTPEREFTDASFPAELFLNGLALGDLDADGALDAAMVLGPTAPGIAVALGDGAGGFTEPLALAGFSAGAGRAVSIVDVDGDDKLDLVVLDLDGTAIQVGINDTPTRCAGDCDQDGDVSIDELVLSVGIALGSRPVTACSAVDADGNERVAINELIAAVGRALDGCPP